MPNQNPNEAIPIEVPGEKHEQGHTLGDPKGNNPSGNRQQSQASGAQATQPQQGAGQRNEGEGNRTAARQYNAAAQQAAQNPSRTDRQAQDAKRAIDSPEGEDLERAEEAGKKPARH